MSPLPWLFDRRSPAGLDGVLSILIFHRVHAKPDPLFPGEVDAQRFDSICGWLRRWFNVLPLDRGVAMLAHGSLPARALAITFDDGYADNQAVALPILQRHGLSATFFIATGFMDHGCMWNDLIIEAVRCSTVESVDCESLGVGTGRMALASIEDRRQLVALLVSHGKYLPPPERDDFCASVQQTLASGARPPQLMMNAGQLASLQAAGMGIGAHTVSHPILKGLDSHAATDEIRRSKEHLEALVDAPVELFAYPNGKYGIDFDDATADIVESLGFAAAVTTDAGVGNTRSRRFYLPRFTPWQQGRLRFASALYANMSRVTA